MKGLSLFTGIGGIDLALSPWMEPLAYCEIDRYAQAVLLSRMRENKLSRAPIIKDVRGISGKGYFRRKTIDIIYGGFPCQDISVAGKGVGITGERSGLFFEIMRLVDEFKPSLVFLENVPAIRTRGLDRVLQEFTQRRYDCRWTMLSAAEVGACHKRERWFMLASNPGGERLERQNGKKSTLDIPARYGEWTAKPDLCRGNNGVQYRTHRIKCLGNACIPIQAKIAFEILIGKRERNEI